MIQDMIQVLGDNKRPCLSIRIVNCSIEGGYHGIRLDFCKKSLVMSNTIRKVENTGIGLYSCQDIRLEYNTIIDVNTEHKWQTSYGISATYHYGDPKSRNILIANNTVINNPFWEALDTHGGEHICFINNKIKNCWRGIAAVGDDHSIHQVCDDIKIINNTIDCSSVSLSNGIVFTGIGDDELSESFTIKDNIIHSAVIGLYSNYTSGVILENNKVTAKDEGWRDKGSYDIVFKKNIIELGKEEPTYYEKCGVYLSLSKCSSHNIIGSFKDNTLRTNYAPGFVAPQNFAKVDAKMAFQNNYIETLTTKYKGGAVSDNSINMHYFNAIFE